MIEELIDGVVVVVPLIPRRATSTIQYKNAAVLPLLQQQLLLLLLLLLCCFGSAETLSR
jgi:hypothetical protein